MYEINRSVITLVPQEAFFNWLSQLPDSDLGDLTLEDLQASPNSYMVSPCEDLDQVWDELEAHCAEIFSAELADWCEETTTWPDLTLEILDQWFEIRASLIVADLCDDELDRSEFEAIEFSEE